MTLFISHIAFNIIYIMRTNHNPDRIHRFVVILVLIANSLKTITGTAPYRPQVYTFVIKDASWLASNRNAFIAPFVSPSRLIISRLAVISESFRLR